MSKADQYQRIVVIGTSGSGKTTLARQISQKLAIAHWELDALHWEANWTAVAPDVFKARVEEKLQADRWIVDGNYSKVRDLIWRRADTLIWLDYSFPIVFGRSLRRSLWRAFSGEELWNGNRESWQLFFSHYSMPLWVIRTYGRRRRETPQLLQQPEYAHLKVVHLSSPKTTQQWLEVLCKG